MNSKRLDIFPTTVIDYDLTNHPDRDLLLKYISIPSNSDSHGLLDNGTSSFKVKEDFLREPEFIGLRNDIQKCLDDYCMSLGISYVTFENSWFSIMGKGGQVGTHSHGASIINGAYYPLLKENTCNLYFKNPVQSAVIFTYKNTTRSDFQYNDVCIQIKENHLYLFPGWLHHYTEKNRGDERIVVSFNAKFY